MPWAESVKKEMALASYRRVPLQKLGQLWLEETEQGKAKVFRLQESRPAYQLLMERLQWPLNEAGERLEAAILGMRVLRTHPWASSGTHVGRHGCYRDR